MREKYITIDSKIIYERVSKICKESTTTKDESVKK